LRPVVPLPYQKTCFCLPLSIYTHTFQSLSPFFSSLFCLFVILSQMKRCFFSKPVSPSAPGSFHKVSTKGSATGGALEGGTDGFQESRRKTTPTASPPGLCWYKAGMKSIRSTNYLLFSSLVPIFNNGAPSRSCSGDATSTSSTQDIPGCTAQGPNSQQQEGK